VVIAAVLIGVTMAFMQFIQPSSIMRPARGPLLAGTVVGSVLLVGGLALAWLAFATPLIRSLTPAVVRPSLDQMALGAGIWGVSLVAPPAFAIVGFIRLWGVASTIRRRPVVGPVGRVAEQLGDDVVVAPIVHLADGRQIRNVVVGPFGIAVLAEATTPRNTRRHGTAWELRRHDGRWVPLENPLERAARDAERLRGWISSEDRDFLVKAYAAYVTTDATVARTSSCAVVLPDQIPAWLASLPPQRSLNESRYADLVEAIRSIA
jgi:hypothetical protein